MSDIEIIKELESRLGTKLGKVSTLSWNVKGYRCNKNGHVYALGLPYCNLDTVKDIINYLTKLKHLTDLTLCNNLITHLDGIELLRNVRNLNLRSNKIWDVKPLEKLTNLTSLNLAANQIVDISGLHSIKGIRELNLAGNQIENINPLSDLVNLNTLNLEHNKISNVDGIYNLKDIKKLNLLNNIIKEIRSLKGMTTLEELFLSDNQIRNIAPLRDLKKLKILHLNRNRIEEIPDWITEFDMNIEYESISTEGNIYIAENPITNPPVEIIKRGKDAIRNYFKQINGREKDYLFEAKLILVGEERAGKTTISEALRANNFVIDPESKSTEGIDIKQWEIEKRRTNTDRNFTFNIWDFGGQEIYHSTHQFFLTKRSLYLFVTEARKDLRYDDFYYWLNIINILAGDSPVIMIQNKTDQDHKKQSIDEYRRLFPQIIYDLQAVSCNSKNQDWTYIYKPALNILKENIYKIIKEKKLKGVGDELPKPWVSIRNEINKLSRNKVNHISLMQYFEICNQNELNSEEAMFLSDYFHDLGVFLHFKDDIQLRDTIFINHEWVTKAIYNVFDNKKIKDAEGKFTDGDLLEIWNEPQFIGKQAQLLNLMKNHKFKICYQHDSKYYLAPQLFNDKPKQFSWRTTKNNIKYRYQYEFMPKGILSQLIVLMHRYVYKDIFWLHGVLFEYKATRAIVKEDRFGKKNLITINIEGDAKLELLGILVSKIFDINASYTNLKIVEQYACNCNECSSSDNPNYLDSDDIGRAIKKGLSKIPCMKSFENVDIHQLLGLYIPWQEITKEPDVYDLGNNNRFVSMNKLYGNSKVIKIFLASSSELELDRKEFEIFINRENKQLNRIGIFIELIIWEDFIDSMSRKKLQSEYNLAIAESDIFVSLFFTKVGKFSEEEFEVAFGNFKKNGKPLVYTYFKNDKTILNRNSDIDSKVAFEKKLQKLGHYKTIYKNTEDLKYQFKMQLQKVLPNLLHMIS